MNEKSVLYFFSRETDRQQGREERRKTGEEEKMRESEDNREIQIRLHMKEFDSRNILWLNRTIGFKSQSLYEVSE